MVMPRFVRTTDCSTSGSVKKDPVMLVSTVLFASRM